MTNERTSQSNVSVVCPCYNEAEVIEMFYRKLVEVLDAINDVAFELVFVDDGSTDNTLSIANRLAETDARIRVCSLARNFGHQIALTAGLDFARGDAVIMMDTDLQHPPELIPELIHRWRSGCDIVSAVRSDTDDASWFKTVTSKGFYAVLNAISRTQVPAGVADFTLLSKPVYESLRGMRERHRFIRGMISWMGFNRGFVDYRANERAAGTTKYSLRRMMAMATDAVLSFSSTPLLLATQVGAAVTTVGFVYLIWIFVRAVVLHDLVHGWTSLMAVTLVLGGCQLLFIGLIGQYLARVFDEAKGRPLYTVKQAPQDTPSPSDTENFGGDS